MIGLAFLSWVLICTPTKCSAIVSPRSGLDTSRHPNVWQSPHVGEKKSSRTSLPAFFARRQAWSKSLFQAMLRISVPS
jgi:hypothetical protein